MEIHTKYSAGQKVLHVTEPTGGFGVVTAFMARGANHSYEVQWDARTSAWHLDFELMPVTAEPGVIGWRAAP
jgi:hypothetical protein